MAIYHGSLGEISNAADWIQSVQPVDEDGNDIDLSTVTVNAAQVVLRNSNSNCNVLSASLGSGVSIVAPALQWAFTPSQLACLCPGTYVAGVSITINNIKSDLIIGTVTVIGGV